MKSPRPHRRLHGFGLLEVILVFAIVIGAAAVVFSVFQSANAQRQADAGVAQFELLGANIQSFLAANQTNIQFFGQGNNMSADYHAAGITPTSMMTTPDQPGLGQSVFGSEISVSPNYTRNYVLIEYGGISQAACQLMAAALYARYPTHSDGTTYVFVNNIGLGYQQSVVSGGAPVCNNAGATNNIALRQGP
jgi:type II secretory pathway pseudopilin PulG